jgi:primosomal protein N'
MQLGFFGRVFVQSPSSFDVFMRNLADAKLYQNWRRSNPGEAARFDAFVVGGTAPSMLTPFGRALIAVVEMRQS